MEQVEELAERVLLDAVFFKLLEETTSEARVPVWDAQSSTERQVGPIDTQVMLEANQLWNQ